MLLGPTNTALDVAVLLERGFRDGSIALSNPADDIQPQRGTSVLPASDLSQPFDQRPNRWVRLALQFGVAGGIAVVVVAIRSLMLENIELAHRGGNFDWFHQFNGKLLLLVSIPSVLVGFHDLINGLEKFVAKRTIRRKS
jgi:hypothetical protein